MNNSIPSPHDVFSRYRRITEEWVAIPSISTDPAHRKACREAAQWAADRTRTAGAKVEVVEGYGNPLVLARWDVGASTTVLVYGHYDVQPASREEGWESDPFTLTEREGRLWGRGVMDNKGQVAIHLAVIEALVAQGALAHNVVVLLEGDEETGSPHLEEAVRALAPKLCADAVLVSDGVRLQNLPTLELSFRGGLNMSVEVRTLAHDLHSGVYGSVVPNAAEVLTTMLAGHQGIDALRARLTRISPPVPPEVEADLALIPFDRVAIEQEVGTSHLQASGAAYYRRVGWEPAVEVTTLASGYLGTGFRNAIPAHARAHLNVRIAPPADPAAAVAQARQWWQELCDATPAVVEHTCQFDLAYRGVYLPRSSSWLTRAAQLWEAVAHKTPVRTYCGGSIPVVTLFHEVLKAPLAVVPLANEGSNIHAPNENFSLELIHEGLAWSLRWFGNSFT